MAAAPPIVTDETMDGVSVLEPDPMRIQCFAIPDPVWSYGAQSVGAVHDNVNVPAV